MCSLLLWVSLEDGSGGSVLLLGFLGGLGSSLVWIIWESWSVNPLSGWGQSPVGSVVSLEGDGGGHTNKGNDGGEFHFDLFIY